MVKLKKNPSNDYHKCRSIFEKHFSIWQDEWGVENIYEKRYKGLLLNFLQYFTDYKKIGWYQYHYNNSVDIWGKRELFCDIAKELEKEGFEVVIYD